MKEFPLQESTFRKLKMNVPFSNDHDKQGEEFLDDGCRLSNGIVLGAVELFVGPVHEGELVQQVDKEIVRVYQSGGQLKHGHILVGKISKKIKKLERLRKNVK